MFELERELTRLHRLHLLKMHDAATAAYPALDVLSYALLRHLQEQGSARAVDLAEQFHVTRATVSRHVARLMEDGLLHGDPDPDDGRVAWLSLTEAGDAAIAACMAARQATFDRLFATWSGQDREEFARLLRQFNDRVEHVGDDADPVHPATNGMQ